MTPTWVSGLLGSRGFRLFARIVLTTPFWTAGIQHAVQWPQSLHEMTHFGLSPPELYVALTVVTCLAGAALVIAGGKWTWLGAGALGVFTALTIPIAHAFWKLQGEAMESQLRTTLEHLSIIGGLMVMAVLANGGREAASARQTAATAAATAAAEA